MCGSQNIYFASWQRGLGQCKVWRPSPACSSSATVVSIDVPLMWGAASDDLTTPVLEWLVESNHLLRTVPPSRSSTHAQAHGHAIGQAVPLRRASRERTQTTGCVSVGNCQCAWGSGSSFVSPVGSPRFLGILGRCFADVPRAVSRACSSDCLGHVH